MGLDMYLEKKTYVKNWDFMKPEERHTIGIIGPEAKKIKPERISYITEQVMKWRKANHIHGWFIRNCADGDESRTRMYVSSGKISALLAACNEVIAGSELVSGKVSNGTVYDKENPKGKMQFEEGKIIKDTTVADRVLPTQSGFFFGSTEYNEWYLKDVIATRDRLNELRAEDVDADYEYRASW